MIETMIALVILASVLVMMAPAGVKYISGATRSRREIQAAAIVETQISQIVQSPVYDSLSARFAGTVNNVGFTGWKRVTQVVRTGTGSTSDITRVTVTVSGTGLAKPIARSMTIAAP